MKLTENSLLTASGIRVEIGENGFWEFLKNKHINKIWCSYEKKTCTVFYTDGCTKEINTGCDIYNIQYGTPVTSDGKSILISKWGKGLFSYALKTGDINWQVKATKTNEFLLFDDYVTLMCPGKSIIKIDINNGEVIHEWKGKSLLAHYLVNHNVFLAYWLHDCIAIIDSNTTEIIRKFKRTEVFQDVSKDYVITGSYLEDGNIVIVGFVETSLAESVMFKRILCSIHNKD